MLNISVTYESQSAEKTELTELQNQQLHFKSENLSFTEHLLKQYQKKETVA